MSTKKIQYEYEIEYDSIEEMVSMGVQYGLLSKEDREDVITYVKCIYKCDHFLDPTDLEIANNEIRVPYTIDALVGLLRQREAHISLMKEKLEKVYKGNVEVPAELKSGLGGELMQKAVEAGLFSLNNVGQYTWLKSASLFGYFADQITDALELRHDNGRIPWLMFEFVTNRKSMLPTAKNAVYNYSVKGMSPPEGDDIVDAILKEIGLKN